MGGGLGDRGRGDLGRGVRAGLGARSGEYEPPTDRGVGTGVGRRRGEEAGGEDTFETVDTSGAVTRRMMGRLTVDGSFVSEEDEDES